jgi:hypothetical protein
MSNFDNFSTQDLFRFYGIKRIYAGLVPPLRNNAIVNRVTLAEGRHVDRSGSGVIVRIALYDKPQLLERRVGVLRND